MDQTSPEYFTTLNLACACRSISGFVKVPSSELPLPMTLCHCNACRHITGSMYVSDIPIPAGSSPLNINKGELGSYNVTDVMRYFCKKCGCFIFHRNKVSNSVYICTGVLEKVEDLVELKEHEFVADTKDRGLSEWLPDVTRWEGRPWKSERLGNTTQALQPYSPSSSTSALSKLSGYCHCRGVQFDVTPPDDNLAQYSAPWPDILVPYHKRSLEPVENVQWWLCANKTKYLAGTCACNSCRLASGYDIQAWAFIPKVNVFQPNGETLDLFTGTLKRYESSKGVYREFCQNCGATVFWHSEERPHILDVSVGLLDAASGARAEEWLEWWTKRVSFQELASNQKLISQFSKGLYDWGEKMNSVLDGQS